MSPEDGASGAPRKNLRRWVTAIIGASIALMLLHPVLLGAMGSFLVVDDPLAPVDAAVVLSTGVEYYPRLTEAARLYKNGLVRRVVINGNRKTEALRHLEDAGFTPCCPWYEESLRILAICGVPRDRVVMVDAPEAYDTVSEAAVVGAALADLNITRAIITTSKFHTRRALYTWRRLYDERLLLQAAAAGDDPFDPTGWWHEGRQIRWVLAEYGAWP